MKVTLDQARKVVQTVDCGLTRGLGQPEPGSMCVEAAVCYVLGLRHSDSPVCVDDSVRGMKILLNDKPSWGSDQERAKALRRIAVAQLGSDTALGGIGRTRLWAAFESTLGAELPPADPKSVLCPCTQCRSARWIGTDTVRARLMIEAIINGLRAANCDGIKLMDQLTAEGVL